MVVRRFSNTLRDSVYQQIQWAIEVLGLEDVFRCRVSPMEITYTPTGLRLLACVLVTLVLHALVG